MNFIINVLKTSWDLLVDSSVYIVFGLIVAGLLRVFLNPGSVAKHLGAGVRFAIFDLWGDLAAWFFVGLLLAGVITVLIPDDVFSKYLGTGLPAMLLMLAVGIPLYICATASTPIAAALILKGVSPGASLVASHIRETNASSFLTVLPDTNYIFN